MKSDLDRVVEQYRARGVLKASDFLLKPQDAASLIRELANMDVFVTGCDLWRTWDEAGTNVVELVGAGDLVNHRLSHYDAHWNAAQVQGFISREWPADAEWISFVYADEDVWDSILNQLRTSSEDAG